MPGLYRTPEEKRSLESRNGALQFLAVLAAIEDWKPGQSQVTPELLCDLQYRAIVNIYSCAGNFRDGAVDVRDGDNVVHSPPKWQEVPDLVAQMCDYVNTGWNEHQALHIASYLLWRLNWIHPFFGGNGRTARAISYLALCAKLGFRLPGRITIPDHIVKRRTAYLDALRQADEAWRDARIDVTAMERLMESVMAAQMVDIIEQASGRQIGGA